MRYESLTRLRGTPIEGDSAIDWTDPAEDTTDGWVFDPGGTQTGVDGDRFPIVTKPTAIWHGPISATFPDVAARDRVDFHGLWDVDGDPKPYPNGDSRLVLAVELKKVDG